MLIMRDDPTMLETLLGKRNANRLTMTIRAQLNVTNFVLFVSQERACRTHHKLSEIKLRGFYIPGVRDLAKPFGIAPVKHFHFSVPTETGQTELNVYAELMSLHEYVKHLLRPDLYLWTSVSSLEHENTHLLLHEPNTTNPHYDGLSFLDDAVFRAISIMPPHFMYSAYKDRDDWITDLWQTTDLGNDLSVVTSIVQHEVAQIAQARDAFVTNTPIGKYDIRLLTLADHAIPPDVYKVCVRHDRSFYDENEVRAAFEKLLEFNLETQRMRPPLNQQTVNEHNRFTENMHNILEQAVARVYERE